MPFIINLQTPAGTLHIDDIHHLAMAYTLYLAFKVQCKPSKLRLYPHNWTWKVGALESILGCLL